ncbi:MAG TPA: hypothetical protein VHZ24_18545 [Pirellulales bacterium]|jgi:hypothetical protein|nr:hypothetical protein [Pirellulales bacterium]
MRRLLLSVVALSVAFLSIGTASAAWTVALPGSSKARQIRSMDIHSRPNRPLHFYGNVVRAGSYR